MQPRWRLTALSLSLAFSPASVAAQTHYVTGAPTVVSAGAFATTVVFEGGEIFVGRPGEFAFFPIPANHAGTVHVFGLDDMGNWEETAVLSSESVEVGDGFGMSLAVHGNTLLAGAPKTRGGRGAVYVFTRSDADAPWRAVTTLWSGTRREGDEFGAAVAIDGGALIATKHGRRRLAGAWTEVPRSRAPTSPDERFGSALNRSKSPARWCATVPGHPATPLRRAGSALRSSSGGPVCRECRRALPRQRHIPVMSRSFRACRWFAAEGSGSSPRPRPAPAPASSPNAGVDHRCAHPGSVTSPPPIDPARCCSAPSPGPYSRSSDSADWPGLRPRSIALGRRAFAARIAASRSSRRLSSSGRSPRGVLTVAPTTASALRQRPDLACSRRFLDHPSVAHRLALAAFARTFVRRPGMAVRLKDFRWRRRNSHSVRCCHRSRQCPLPASPPLPSEKVPVRIRVDAPSPSCADRSGRT